MQLMLILELLRQIAFPFAIITSFSFPRKLIQYDPLAPAFVKLDDLSISVVPVNSSGSAFWLVIVNARDWNTDDLLW